MKKAHQIDGLFQKLNYFLMLNFLKSLLENIGEF